MPTHALKMIGLANLHPQHTMCICEKVKDCIVWHILGMIMTKNPNTKNQQDH